MIDRALDAGINFIDTANVYSGRGKSEEAVGDALARNGKRKDVVLATKFHGQMGDGPNDMGASRRHIIHQCEDSLRRLKTDWIDLYQIHRPRSDTPIDETLRALTTSSALARCGTSDQHLRGMADGGSAYVAKSSARTVRLRAAPYNLLDRRIERR
jgi:aryl-alcohol dehydrogenase-like predicted oxidoreductase